MLNLVGESRILNGKTLIINVLGNHLPKDSKGYNPCLEIEFEDIHSAFDYYEKGLRIIVDENKLMESTHEGFKKVLSCDCEFTELTKEEVQNIVKEFFAIYPM